MNPRNIYNIPDAYEAAAIEAFLTDEDTDEVWGYQTEGGDQVFRYVRAMDVSDDCIECHGQPAGELDATGYPKEGWSVGDVAGAVSVVVPADGAMANMRDAIVGNMMFFLAVVAAMALLIYVVISRLITEPLTELRASFSVWPSPARGRPRGRWVLQESLAQRASLDMGPRPLPVACAASRHEAPWTWPSAACCTRPAR